MPGSVVSFALDSGHGTVAPESARADGSGFVRAAWTLGEAPGLKLLEVRAVSPQGASGATEVAAMAVDVDAELDRVFRPPARAERSRIRMEWEGRDIAARGVETVYEGPFDLAGLPASLRVLSHLAGGVRHFGAVIVPEGVRSEDPKPILAYFHGGDSGVSASEIALLSFMLGAARGDFVYVVPSFRSEALDFGDRVWVSEGTPSPWDRDVDDALALINAALQEIPEATGEGLRIVGMSRGAGVALLAAARDARIERTAAFFGPTDFTGEWAKEIAREAAMGEPRPLPGVAHLDSTVVQPFLFGRIGEAEARLEMIRRSAAFFVEPMRLVQLHHGELDFVVPVEQARALMRAMEEIDRTPPDFEAFIYEDGWHNPLSLDGAIERAVEFLLREESESETS